MAGMGDIGGGSVKGRFVVNKGKDSNTWGFHDAIATGAKTIRFTFPKGTVFKGRTAFAPIARGKSVRIKWPVTLRKKAKRKARK